MRSPQNSLVVSLLEGLRTAGVSLVVVAACCASSHGASGQTAQQGRAATEVDTAIHALGGYDTLRQIQGWTVQESATSSAAGETANATSIVINVDEKNKKLSRITQSMSHSTTIMIAGGKSTITTDGRLLRVHGSIYRPISDPAALVDELLNASSKGTSSVKSLGTRTVGSSAVAAVEVSRPSRYLLRRACPQLWFFDTATGLPARVEYEPDPSNPLRTPTVAIAFSSFQSISGVTIPHVMTISADNTPTYTVRITAVTLNPTFDSHTFAQTAGN